MDNKVGKGFEMINKIHNHPGPAYYNFDDDIKKKN